ncbi:MAG: hypothetical protein HY510_08940 [Acidobacteria bacterium]|nr:hypothetical protein [Acidobacteriota bacterium]
MLYATDLMGMNHNGAGRGLTRQGAILAAVLLALATGLCVFPAGHAMADDEGMPPDHCVLILAVSLTVVLLPGPLLGGWAPPDLPSHLVLAPVHALDPPPKSVSLS